MYREVDDIRAYDAYCDSQNDPPRDEEPAEDAGERALHAATAKLADRVLADAGVLQPPVPPPVRSTATIDNIFAATRESLVGSASITWSPAQPCRRAS